MVHSQRRSRRLQQNNETEIIPKSDSEQDDIEADEDDEAATMEKQEHDRVPKRPRMGCVPKLHKRQLLNMLDKKKGYYHVYSTGRVIPYVLPYDIMLLSCGKCSATFNQISAFPYRAHLQKMPESCEKVRDEGANNEIPIMSDDEYEKLKYKPEYFIYSGRLCLRMHQECTTVACPCGHDATFDRIWNHFKTCKFLNQTISKFQANFCPLETESNCASPILHRFVADNNTEEKVPLHDLDLRSKKDYNVYDPYGDKSIQFYTPKNNELSNGSIRKKLIKLDVAITSNWEWIEKTMREALDVSEFGGTEIQAKRYQISLNFDKKPRKCLQTFCERTDYKLTDLYAILQYSKEVTLRDLGRRKYLKGTISTPLLIMSKSTDQQAFHLDIMDGAKRKQYGLLVSNESGSTIMYKARSTGQVVSSVKKMMDLLYEGTKHATDSLHCGEEMNFTMVPSKELLRLIGTIPEKTRIGELLARGYGEVFLIGKGCKELENWESVRIRNAPVGSFSAINGSIIHAGCESEHDDVRTILFWTWHENNLEGYDIETQETTLTMTVYLCAEVWNRNFNMKLELKKELLLLIYYVASSLQDDYMRTAGSTLRQFRHMPLFLADVYKARLVKNKRTNLVSKQKVENLMKIINHYAKDKKLFAANEDIG